MKAILCVALLCCASVSQAQVYSFTGFDSLRQQNLTGQINIDDRLLFIDIPADDELVPYTIQEGAYRFTATGMAFAPGRGGDFTDPPADLLIGGNRKGTAMAQIFFPNAFIYATDMTYPDDPDNPYANSFAFAVDLLDISPTIAIVPEPSGILLGLIGLLGIYRRR